MFVDGLVLLWEDNLGAEVFGYVDLILLFSGFEFVGLLLIGLLNWCVICLFVFWLSLLRLILGVCLGGLVSCVFGL